MNFLEAEIISKMYSLVPKPWHGICHVVGIQQIIVKISINKRLKIAVQIAVTKLNFKLSNILGLSLDLLSVGPGIKYF